MSLTGDVILDFFIIVIIEVLLAVGGTIALVFIIAFVWIITLSSFQMLSHTHFIWWELQKIYCKTKH